MTNQHILKKELINLKQNIIIYFDAQNERREIILNKDERFIEEYKNRNLDLVILEIIEKDNINERYFLLPYLDDLNEYNFMNQNIYIVQFPKGNLGLSKGKILKIDNYEITHDVSTQRGSSGSPIILENTTKVIGIHKGGEALKAINYGDLIYPIVKEFELNNKITYENGDYYIGSSLNNLKHGKGIYYYKNGNIKYEGDFVDDEFEGNGKFYYENGDYYIGEYKNGLKHGKGKSYNKDGNIFYDGDYVNDIIEGNGKLYYENFGYYIGEFKNNFRNGKGKLYYINGNIKYEGDFVNDKINLKEMENIIGKMANTILDNLKMIQEMERVRNIIRKEI